ncbi:hexameric tyrosine-coordinated heme protein [Oceanobacillus senegalensis]|uniref:hexameric tyrosine-coordinated heme protein n=1 Tax=Oceanobacillus senegalensis TaxID=1936063 RepID=UPI0015C43C9B|nr:hexameric tyrosine-coordinated heme protein [Oceanobacillus senegalensis]
MNDWLTSLKTKTPQEGYELAIELARKGVGYIQPSEKIRKKLRSKYAKDADSLMFASQVIAIHFQTVAAANNYWKDKRS